MKKLTVTLCAVLTGVGLTAVPSVTEAAPATSNTVLAGPASDYMRLDGFNVSSLHASRHTIHIAGQGKRALAVNDTLYWFKACAKYSRWSDSRDAYVCEKVYARRQGDGSGWVVNSDRTYARTNTTATNDNCGGAFTNPSVANESHPWISGSQGDVLWEWNGATADLTYANDCNKLYGSGDGTAWLRPGGDNFRAKYAENAHLANQVDPGTDILYMRWDYNGGGFDWTCNASVCTMGAA